MAPKVIDTGGSLVITPEVIDGAIAIILEEGWTKRDYGKEEAGPNCVSAALAISMGLNPAELIDPSGSELEQLVTLYSEGINDSLTVLNDDEFHTYEDAIDFLEWLRDCALEN